MDMNTPEPQNLTPGTILEWTVPHVGTARVVVIDVGPWHVSTRSLADGWTERWEASAYRTLAQAVPSWRVASHQDCDHASDYCALRATATPEQLRARREAVAGVMDLLAEWD